MRHQNNEHQYNKFWFGFALGGAVCGAAAMLMGTKQGRKNLRKTLDYMEHAETQPDQIHKILDTVYSFYHTITEQTTDQKKHSEEELPNQAEPESKKEDVHSINSVIEKMKNITSESKTDKKFFFKTKK